MITGTAQEGQVLTASAAIANDTNDTTVAYQWQSSTDSGAHWSDITGQTSLSHTVTEADEGATLQLVATSTNTDGSGTTATSLATDTVIDAPVISTAHQEVTHNGGSSTLAGLSILDSLAGADPLTITAVAGQGTLALAHSEPNLNTISDGTNGTLSTSGILADINQMLADGVIYAPTETTPGDSSTLPAIDHVAVTVQDSQGNTDAVNFIFNVAGQGPNVSLTGTAGKDVLYNTGYNDTLTGGAGSDTFVFRQFDTSGAHNDTITDFNVSQDFLNFSTANFAHISDLLAASANDNLGNTIITIDAYNTVTMNNVTVQDLTQHQGHILIL